MDTFTRTDGMAVLYEKHGSMWTMIGMTEVIMDNLNPEWVKCFDVSYRFEEKQTFKVTVYDIDDFNNLQAFSKHSLVGEQEFTLHEVVTAKDQILTRQISKSKRDSIIEIIGEEYQNEDISNDQVVLNPKVVFPRGSNVSGKIVFFLIYRVHKEANVPGGAHIWKPIYKSEIKNQLNDGSRVQFDFNQVVLLKQDMCAGDESKDIKFEFFIS